VTLQLDARQRAMLAEMGIRLFQPEAPVQAQPVPERAVAAPQAPRAVAPRAEPPRVEPPRAEPVQARRAPAPVPEAAREAPPRSRDTAIEALDWQGLQEAVASLCAGQRHVFGFGDLQPDVLIVGDPPVEAEEAQGEPFVGDAGRLLDNMLAALGLARRRRVYLTNVIKCRPAGGRNPEPEEIAQGDPILRRQVQLLRPKVIVVMGRFAPALLQTGEPIGKLRGRLHRYEGVPTVVTYPPAYLLRNLPEKAKAWADLCLALSVLKAD
jgi:uracil-DNA glycosylase family 4